MYATCLHCHRALGRNEAIEEFPIGRRLAFDAAKGRLWVICPACQRWNLTPIEERWEAVESCEQLFRGQRLRSQTDNIGLTRISEGTELIRVGRPLRPEFAAWRYGGVFRQRLHRRVGIATGTTALLIASGIFMEGVGVTAALGPLLLLPLIHGSMVALHVRMQSLGTKVLGEGGKTLEVTRANLEHTRLIADDEGALTLDVKHSYGRQALTGDRARRALSTLLTRVNRSGAMSGSISAATSLIAEAGDAQRTIAAIAREAERRTGDFEERSAEFARAPRGKTIGEVLDALELRQRRLRGIEQLSKTPINRGALPRLPRVQRLALEMSLHESSEQHALDEELGSLERAWREAEEIAAIADGLLVSPEIEKRLKD